MRTFLKSEKSMLITLSLLSALRPRSPKPVGVMKAQGLNQESTVWTLSAAIPPCEIVFWQAALGLAATGPAWNGSPTSLGRAYPVTEPMLPDMLAGSPPTFRLKG